MRGNGRILSSSQLGVQNKFKASLISLMKQNLKIKKKSCFVCMHARMHTRVCMCVHARVCVCMLTRKASRSNSTKVMGCVLGLQASAIMPGHLEVAIHAAPNTEPHSTGLTAMAFDNLSKAHHRHKTGDPCHALTLTGKLHVPLRTASSSACHWCGRDASGT